MIELKWYMNWFKCQLKFKVIMVGEGRGVRQKPGRAPWTTVSPGPFLEVSFSPRILRKGENLIRYVILSWPRLNDPWSTTCPILPPLPTQDGVLVYSIRVIFNNVPELHPCGRFQLPGLISQ